MLRCLTVDGWDLSLSWIQLQHLRLHPSLRLLMRTPSIPEVREAAALIALDAIKERLFSGQAIRYGRRYTVANIRLTGIFV